MIMSFEIDCTPPRATHQGSAIILRRKDGSPFVGKPGNSPGAKARKQWLRLLADYGPNMPLEGAVEVEVGIIYPLRVKDKKEGQKQGELMLPTRPDLDNLGKLVLDCMTELGYWGDDSQVTDLTLRKRQGINPGVIVTLSRPNPEPLRLVNIQ